VNLCCFLGCVSCALGQSYSKQFSKQFGDLVFFFGGGGGFSCAVCFFYGVSFFVCVSCALGQSYEKQWGHSG
jgi:hypothetical protein